jgi:endoglucanase
MMQEKYAPLKQILENLARSLFFVIISLSAVASEVVEVLPLTHRIVMVRFSDGKAIYHKNGEVRDNERIVHDPLDLRAATEPSAYRISSSDDAAYNVAKIPTDISQKTKGQAFAWICTDYKAGVGCQNLNAVDNAKDHWLYLTLPTPLVSGKTYTLNTGALAKNGSTFIFKYDETQRRSEAVHVNQVGYVPNATQKFGYLYHWMGTKGGLSLADFAGKPFQLYDVDKKTVVFMGQIAFRRMANAQETGQTADTPNNNFLGGEVYECDFSAFKTIGNYRLVVPNMGCSFDFSIKPDVYFEPLYWLIKGFYQQRSGIELKAPFTDQPRPAPHNPLITPNFSGRLKYTSTRLQDLSSSEVTSGNTDKNKLETNIKGDIDTWGWYQDAGDWDGYWSHTRVPIELMFLYELSPTSYRDNQYQIPESGNNFPDLLDEARWLVRFYHRTRAAMKAKNYGTGGVGGSRIAPDWFGNDFKDNKGTGSWQDTHRTWVVTGEDVFMTFRYAAMAAQLGYIIKSNNLRDPENIDWEKEAIECYEWAIKNTTQADFSASFDLNVYRERLYAAAALYRLTGQRDYHEQFLKDIKDAKISNNPVYSDGSRLTDDWRYPMYIYLLMPSDRPLFRTTLLMLQNANSASARALLETADRRACRWGGDFFMPMLVGQSTSPMISAGVLGVGIMRRYDASLANGLLPAIYTTSDYFLGNNPLNMSWITGVGERSPEEIFCIDSWYLPNYPRKGIVPYGPWTASSSLGEMGPWNNNLPNKTLTPTIENWPGHERWWNMRNSPLSSEYTVHQSMLWSIVAYGFLATNDPTQAPNWGSYNSSYEIITSLATLPQNSFKIYPNPSQGVIRFETSTNETILSYEITDISGKVIEKGWTEGNEINLRQSFAAGVYMLRLKGKSGSYQSKIVFQ